MRELMGEVKQEKQKEIAKKEVNTNVPATQKQKNKEQDDIERMLAELGWSIAIPKNIISILIEQKLTQNHFILYAQTVKTGSITPIIHNLNKNYNNKKIFKNPLRSQVRYIWSCFEVWRFVWKHNCPCVFKLRSFICYYHF